MPSRPDSDKTGSVRPENVAGPGLGDPRGASKPVLGVWAGGGHHVFFVGASCGRPPRVSPVFAEGASPDT
jgi:hypothetical protein